MDLTAIGLGLLVVGALVLYITRPWWGQKDDTRVKEELSQNEQNQILVKQQEALLRTLRDLDFDSTVGKVTEEDYHPLRQTLLAEVAAIMSQLDNEQSAAEVDLDTGRGSGILARGQKPQRQPSTPASPTDMYCPICSRAARPGDLYCTGCGTRLSTTCPTCGNAVQLTDRFCAECGIELTLALAG